MAEVIPQDINSTFVVLDDANNTIPIAVGDHFYEKLGCVLKPFDPPQPSLKKPFKVPLFKGDLGGSKRLQYATQQF